MFISNKKKQFLKKIGGGLHVLMNCSYKADDIGTDPQCPIEEFISLVVSAKCPIKNA
jgi:hypothetical protein